MTCNSALHRHRRNRVVAPMPDQSAGIGAALRSAFGDGDALPVDLEIALAKLGRIG